MESPGLQQYGHTPDERMSTMLKIIESDKEHIKFSHDLTMKLLDKISKLDIRVYEEQIKEAVIDKDMNPVSANYYNQALKKAAVVRRTLNLKKENGRFFKDIDGKIIYRIKL